MRPVVAIVAARPETILEDYRRAMDLAQLGGRTAQGEPVLAVTSCRGRWLPGFASPPGNSTVSWPLCPSGLPPRMPPRMPQPAVRSCRPAIRSRWCR